MKGREKGKGGREESIDDMHDAGVEVEILRCIH